MSPTLTDSPPVSPAKVPFPVSGLINSRVTVPGPGVSTRTRRRLTPSVAAPSLGWWTVARRSGPHAARYWPPVRAGLASWSWISRGLTEGTCPVTGGTTEKRRRRGRRAAGPMGRTGGAGIRPVMETSSPLPTQRVKEVAAALPAASSLWGTRSTAESPESPGVKGATRSSGPISRAPRSISVTVC